MNKIEHLGIAVKDAAAFDVTDIYAEMERLKSEGFVLLNEQPKQGADNKLICFVHPKSSNGVLIELCQEIATGPYPLAFGKNATHKVEAQRASIELTNEITLYTKQPAINNIQSFIYNLVIFAGFN
jgi:hypothetical protein